jgi:glycosyltransferase involved in cell wall biosynthesis
LAQTLQEWEAILVDDGATDSTGRICDEYAERDSRFRVIHTRNQGVPSARNEGIKVALGEKIYFMGPDDWIYPTCFERCYDTFKQYCCEIVYIGSLWEESTHSYETKQEFCVSDGIDVIKKIHRSNVWFFSRDLEFLF